MSGVPMRRVATAEEIAKAAIFLASDESSFVTGASLCGRRRGHRGRVGCGTSIAGVKWGV